MNFSPFASQFASIPNNVVNQFSGAKFGQNLNSANGQVMGLVSGGDGGVFLRPMDNSGQFTGQITTNNGATLGEQPQAFISLPITMPGAKPGDAQQTVHIQVMNPNAIQQPTAKFQMGQMPIPIQSNQPGGTTVLTVAYSPQDGKFLPNHGFPDNMTVLAALQPQDLQLIAQAQAYQIAANQQQQQQQLQQQTSADENENEEEKSSMQSDSITVKQEPSDWENSSVSQPQPDYSDYLAQNSSSIPFNLQPFLKFNPGSIKFEPEITISSPAALDESNNQTSAPEESTEDTKQKRKRRAKKKPPKVKQPKPGQVLIATAMDGTTLFCCPECQMAYPEKENLEQHLSVHKIERRYICDICGAGLKRKEHLERHKSGHNPDRPYICSVCMKGFKRKEHLNLHFVIHSGEKNEICGECGKGFYRKDHLRKHANSHAAKRLREEMNARAGVTNSPNNSTGSISLNNNDSKTNDNTNEAPQHNITIASNLIDNSFQSQTTSNSDNNTLENCMQNMQTNTQAAISLSTVYVPTSDNTTLPVQIHIPQIVTTSSPDGTTTSTIVMPNNQSAPLDLEAQANSIAAT